MGNAVFPTLPGLGWSVTKRPNWKTKVQTAASGRELRGMLRSSPIWDFGLTYEVLREGSLYQELQTLMGFFNARYGSFDSFLYTDPTDNTVTGQGFGAGDGSTKVFQLVRSYGGFAEPVMNLNGTPTIKVAGAVVVPSSIVNGLVTFAAAPANGAALTWDGSFYFRCRFMEDAADFENFMQKLWNLKQVELKGSLGKKI